MLILVDEIHSMFTHKNIFKVSEKCRDPINFKQKLILKIDNIVKYLLDERRVNSGSNVDVDIKYDKHI